MVEVSERRRHAIALFAPLGPTYERVGRLLSFGRTLSGVGSSSAASTAGPGDTVLDVATGTGAVARELVRRYGCRVVGLDQSAAMLAEARRVAATRAWSSCR